jgi:ATP-binding cassette subfamily A (ABC1) protein 3
MGWNYTMRADGTFGVRIYVKEEDNDVQIYVLPFQNAVDRAIASLNGTTLPETVDEYPFTSKTQEEREESIRTSYMGALIDIMGVALYIGVCGVTYQLTGQMASEREGGISQLVEAMSPAKKPWQTQAARLLSNHIAFDIIYLPGWIIMGIIIRQLAFVHANVGILIIYHILVGGALTSFSIFGASFFKKAQLSGITMVIIPIILAIIAQVAGPYSTGAVAVLSLLFPSMNYVWFITCIARWERTLQPVNLVKSPPVYNDITWTLPGIAFWILCIVQIFAYPVLGAFVERWLYGTVSKERKTSTSSPEHSIILSSFSKHWAPSWFRTNVLAKIGIKPPETIRAVNDFSIKARRGQIMVLLGANGSGKSTTLDAISGLNTITSGSIEIDGTGGLGLCPQKNVMWDELTVFEHVQIFNKLKSAGTTDNKETIKNLIRACDLGHKMNAQSKTLSGGQKRKLQLAMMFTGGSRVCCVDEVSSGLDPLSRRKIWEILLAERGDRTFLLTTHFLDEVSIPLFRPLPPPAPSLFIIWHLLTLHTTSRLTFSPITLPSFLAATSKQRALPSSSSITSEQATTSPTPRMFPSLLLMAFASPHHPKPWPPTGSPMPSVPPDSSTTSVPAASRTMTLSAQPSKTSSWLSQKKSKSTTSTRTTQRLSPHPPRMRMLFCLPLTRTPKR